MILIRVLEAPNWSRPQEQRSLYVASPSFLTYLDGVFQDLTQAGVSVEPFFISTDEKPFDPTKFYSVFSDLLESGGLV